MLAENLHRHHVFETLNSANKEKLFNWLNNANLEILPYQKVFDGLSNVPIDGRIFITSSPTKSAENTILFSQKLIESGRKVVVPHIAARHFTNPEHVAKAMISLQNLNLNQIFSIAGDNPEPSGQFKGSLDFLKEMQKQKIHFKRINIAGYPEGHPTISNKILENNLLDKQAWAQETKTEMSIITQMCFDSKKVVDWVEKIRKLGVKLPVVVGVSAKGIGLDKLLEFAKKSGVGDSINFLKSNPHLAFKLSMSTIFRKKYDTDDFLIELSKMTFEEHKIEGIHIFTFNNIVSTMEWIQKSKDSLK